MQAAGAAVVARGEDLSFQDDNERRRKEEASPPMDTDDLPRGRRRRTTNTELGQALRQAYDDAIEEAIPPEMLDLLGKLG